MKKNNIIFTIRKELRSIFRDKKTIFMILGFPFIISAFIFFFGYMEDTLMGTEDTKYAMGINYKANSTEKTIMSELFLEPKYYETIEEMKKAYDEGKIETYIFYNEKENLYTIYSNEDLMNSQASSYAMEYLDAYNKHLGDLYIKGEDIDPEVAYGSIVYEVKTTEGEELSTDGFMIDMVMDMSFTYIIMAIALAAVNMATSAIAVEKENGTLETILTLPVTTKELITGKYLATAIIGLISSIIGFILTIISFAIATDMFEVYKGFSITFGAIFWGLIICIVAALLIAALAILLTSSAKSYKEAQAAGQVLQMVCIMPIFISFLNITTTTLYYIIPVLSHTTILMDLYSGNISYFNLFLTIASTIVYVIILLYVLIKKFKSEKVLFGA